MPTPTTDYPGLLSACGAALSAIEANDYLTARSKALEAQFIVLAIGHQTEANSARMALAADMVGQILDNLTKLEQYFAAKTTNGRTIRVGLYNGGRRGGLASPSNSDGVFHE